MYDIYPYFTNDGSVGLFSPADNDIYHSTHGALTEAFEKFILPLNLEKILKDNNEIKLLDICYGIGYNTKSFIKNLLEILYNYQIGSDKNIYNDKLYSDNKKYKIFIDAVDIDKNLALLSPFFITNKKNIKNNDLPFDNNKIKQLLSQTTITSNYFIENEINLKLLKYFINQLNEDVLNILNSKKYSPYFDSSLKAYLSPVYKNILHINPYEYINAFLHNIYYKYISKHNKNAIKAFKLVDFNFNYICSDVRDMLKNSNSMYNLMFLDAFTPVKCPNLWSLDFFKLLYNHLDQNGIILTYSNSAQIRNAFINAGFFVYKTYSKTQKKYTGTVAVKSKSTNIFFSDLVHELSDYDLGLLKTKAGIFYRDENLDLSNEQIIAQHEIEVKISNLISSSKYKKQNLPLSVE